MASRHSSDSSDSSDGFPSLSLTEQEMKLSPWDQMLKNGAIKGKCVTTSNSRGSSILGDDSDLDDYFSDGELSGSEQLTSGKRKLAADNTPVLELREYQKELAENALRGDNTIICAPTGSGKTRVATYIILSHFKKSDGRMKKVAFLAKTVPLAVQQYKALCKYLPSYQMTCITGQSGEPMSLHILLRFYDIIVMTPQILENHLQKKFLHHLGVFSMVLFDECHHTRKKDPYKVLMTSYLKLKDQISDVQGKGKDIKFKLPQIIGLTATIGVDKAVTVKEATQNILKVCGNLDMSNLSTVQTNKAELAKTVPVPTEEFIQLMERDEDESVVKLQKIMETLEKQLNHYVKELNDHGFTLGIVKDVPVSRKSQVYEQWAVKAKKDAKEVAIHDPYRETTLPVRLSIIILEYLIAYRAALETYDLVELRDVIEYLERYFQEFKHEEATTGEMTFYRYFEELKNLVLTRQGEKNPNLRKLAKVVIKYVVKKGDDSRGIIFVRTRALAEALSTWFNRCGIAALQNLNAYSFTGSNVPEEKGGTSQAHQEVIIQRFRSGEIRLLVATSVAEEGLDIPQCNLVIKYNHVGSEVSTVQTRGRSRAFGGVSVLLAMGPILQREYMNHSRVKLMEKAIEKIQKMDPAKFKQVVEDHQKKLLQEAKIAELVQRKRKSEYQYIPFRMVCAWCRKVAVDGANVKIVSESQHISIDRNLLDHIEVIPDKQPKEIGECLRVGTVKCKGESEPGTKCKNKLGRVVKHQQIPFVTLEIRSFAFDLGNKEKLETFKKWKEANFAIETLTFDDIERYLEDVRVLPDLLPTEDGDDDNDTTFDNSDDNDDDSGDDGNGRKHNTVAKRYPLVKKVKQKHDDIDHEDSDDDSDDDDENRKRPPCKNFELDKSPGTKQADAVLSHDLGRTTDHKVVPSSQGVNLDGVSTAGLTKLQDTTNSHVDEGSSFSNSGADKEGSDYSSNTDHSNTASEGAVGHVNVVASNVLKSEGSHSVQPSVISFKSQDGYNHTSSMPMGREEGNVNQIAEIQFQAEINEIFKDAPPLTSGLSSVVQLPESGVLLPSPAVSLRSSENE